MAFTPAELGAHAPADAQKQYLRKFGFEPPPLPSSYVHPSNSPGANTSQASAATVAAPKQEVVNKLVAKRKPKRGVLSSIPSAAVPSAANQTNGVGNNAARPVAPSAQRPAPSAQLQLGASITTDGFGYDEPMDQDAIPPRRTEDFSRPTSRGRLFDHDQDAFGDEGDVRIDALDTHSPIRPQREDGSAQQKPARARTLGGDRVREAVTIRELVAGGGPAATSTHAAGSGAVNKQIVLEAPAVLTYISTKMVGPGDLVFEGKNEEAGPSEVSLLRGKATEWLDYLPAAVVALVATPIFCAAATTDGSVVVYSPTGRRLMPTLSLGSSCAHFVGAEGALMTITTDGMLHAW
jgi:protein HIRA/HIR1